MIKIFLQELFIQKQLVIANPAKDRLKKSFAKYASSSSKSSRDIFDRLKFEKIPVRQTAFYDLGFDPDFSFDGNFFYKTQSSFFQLLIKMISSVIKYYTYFLQNPEKKAFQELVQIEKSWQKAAQAKGMLYPADDLDMNKGFWQIKAPYICELKEHQFFKQLSKIASINKSTKNVYPSELLKPLHRFNRPQTPSHQSKKHVLKESVRNIDVARLDTWGFTLLGNHNKGYFIEHSSFLKAINKPGNKLKHTIRELRVALRQENYEVFNEKLNTFKLHWNKYIASHDLLKELSFVYLQKNFFEKNYQAMEELYQEMQNPDIYHGKNFLIDLNTKIKNANNQEESSNQLYETFLSKLPTSLTAKKILEDRAIPGKKYPTAEI